ncbi:hypothetical protein [Paenibacillus sp. NFR01]|uniref:hypothetical protein n=1 Tax=Paenibacillus sp. NFR01 TaxID=1566279 RepID=UPI0008CB071A|nr:hypothetical protein [Paenibacillus sp. NFR01]SEU26320.1 hypothetical protein SAMN03159358_4486 [Paenibacillus sp. NFR01]
MTILAVYRWGDKAVFASDFRVSFRAGNQVDVMSKFMRFGDRLGIFIAGDVSLWRGAVPIIEGVRDRLTLENAVQDDGPLKLALQRYTESLNTANHPSYGGIGVMVDAEGQRNAVFSINGQAGYGVSISSIEDGCTVMGSGQAVPMIQEHLRLQLEAITSRLDDPYDVEAFLSRETLNWISRCGASAFRKLGITPALATSRVEQGSFNMTGVEVNGSVISVDDGSSTHYHYTFERIEDQIMLLDHRKQRSFMVNEIVDFSVRTDDELFDPEGLSEGFDPTPYAVEGSVFFMNQRVTGSRVTRQLFRTATFEYRNQTLCHPGYELLAGQVLTELDVHEREAYQPTREIGLVIPPEKVGSFVAGVGHQIQNHEWMAEHIANYHEIYRSA